MFSLGSSSSQDTSKSSSESKSSRHDRDKHDRHHRDSKREKDGDRYRSKVKRASIGIQCRRDKTKEKLVGFDSANTRSTPGDYSKTPEHSTGPKVDKCFAGYSMANPCYHLGDKYKYGHLMRVEVHPNGGAKVLHLWNDEISSLAEKEVENIAKDFIKVSTTIISFN